MRLLIIRIGIVLFFALAILQGVLAGRDTGHRPAPAPPAAPPAP